MSVLLQLQCTIFALILVGFILIRFHILNKDAQKVLTDLVINVVLPCNIIKAFCMDFTDGMGNELIMVIIISIFIQFLSVFYGKIVFRRQPEGQKKCLQYGTICSNAGFLGNPIAEGVFGGYGLLLASVFLIPLRIMMWSEGIAIFSGISDRKTALKKAAVHPCILACVLGLVLLLTGFRFPEFIQNAIGYLGSCNTALSMLIIGMILSDMDLKSFLDKTVLIYSGHRLLVLPLLVYLFTGLLPVTPVVRGICVLLTAMPAGATTSILAAKYNMEPEFGTKLVIVSTLLSLPSLALWSTLII